jgi:tryptophan-rich sensory protein
MRKSSFLVPLAVAALGWLAVASIGGALTEIGPWYRALAKPAWQPPDWVFAPVWTSIFIICAVATALAWQAAGSSRTRKALISLLVVNGLLNIGWSFLFFYMQRPFLAALEVILLWTSIAALILLLRRVSLASALLLVPYLLWVSFAAYLNWTIVQLNP